MDARFYTWIADAEAASASASLVKNKNLQFAILILLGNFLLFVFPSVPLSAQERSTPTLSYYAAFHAFYEGDYKEALKRFKRESRGSIKTVQTRWIDSICYETMIGECYYHMGVLDQALAHYTEALRLYLRFPDWMVQVNFPPSIRPATAGARKRVPWGLTKRKSQMGQYPSSMLINQGRINNMNVIKQGGIVQQAVMFPITPQEIVRCTVLALRRRTELLGPLSKHDPMTGNLLSALMHQVGPPNHWSEAWVDLERGLAYIAAGREGLGLPLLQRSLLVAGEFDHPLTSYALLELGRLALRSGDYTAASDRFIEASYTAVNYSNLDVLEEAFRLAAVTHLSANRQGVFPPLMPAIGWAKVKHLRQFRASLLILAAESCAVTGQTTKAASALDEAQATIRRYQMGEGWIGARFHAARALVLFQQRKTAEGNAALAAALGYMRHGAHWLFHITLADNYYLNQGGQATTSRIAVDLFAEVLRDPRPVDWTLDPLESLAVLATPHPLPFEHWFEAALLRKDYETAVEIADRARRHRFFTSLGLGGRLESLRWMLEAPVAMLDLPSQLVRQDLRARYPRYKVLSDQARAIRQKLSVGPLVPAETAAERELAQSLEELAGLSARQEAILREMAVRREPAALVFPPVRPTREVKMALPDGHAALIFFATSQRLYGVLLSKEKYSYWKVQSPVRFQRQMQLWLRTLGQHQQNSIMALKDLTDTQWKTTGARLLDQLVAGPRADLSKPFEELVIVPDGILWYLPFEALQVKIEGQLQSLQSRFRIRYAPTFSLATPVYPPIHKPQPKTAVVLGKLSPREDDALMRAAFTRLQRAVPGAVALKAPPPAPTSVYGVLFDRFIVLDDLTVNEQKPYAWDVSPLDRGKPGGTLGDWIRLPWGGPAEILLPGYHTTAEDSLRRVGRGLPGNDVFLPLCGLMSNGARTILLSRWRTGGQSSYDIVREFTQELPHTSPADAWQRAVLLQAETQLNLDAEPRVKKGATDATPKGDHAFFWAGYMLVDSGRRAEPLPEKRNEPAVPRNEAAAPPPEFPPAEAR